MPKVSIFLINNMFIEKLALFKVNIVYDIPRLDLDVQPVDSKMQHRAGTLSKHYEGVRLATVTT